MDLWDLIDLRTPWCAYVVATLRIPQLVESGVGDVGELAREAGCDERALHNVLAHLVSQGVFTEPSPGVFAHNETSAQLTAPFLDLGGMGGRMAHAWSTLETYVSTGRPGYAERFGLPFWDDLAAHPALAAEFDDLIGPGGHGTPDARFELRDGWNEVHTVADVGGGTGAFLRELIALRGVRGILVDLPGTVARAEGDFETVGQSFFDPLPAADLIVLKSVLNDWPDEETDAILARAAEAAPRRRGPRRGRARRGAAPARHRDGPAGRPHRLTERVPRPCGQGRPRGHCRRAPAGRRYYVEAARSAASATS